MTSANTIEYNIYNKKGEVVGRHSHNIMCMRCNDGLEEFTPASDFEIEDWGYDEEEGEWVGEKTNLGTWLSQNKGEYTHKRFQEGDYIILKRKAGEGVVKSVMKGTFVDAYMVEFPDGEIIEVKQNQILPPL
jgi:hypothetical protein